MHDRVAQYEDLEGVIKLASYNDRIRQKQSNIKKDIEEMRIMFTNLNLKIQNVIKEQNESYKKTTKPKASDVAKDKKWLLVLNKRFITHHLLNGHATLSATLDRMAKLVFLGIPFPSW